MSEVKNDGGPAFPVSEWVDEPTGVVLDGTPMMGRKLMNVGGMTLRDYFAAAALQGMAIPTDSHLIGERAQMAYAIADAMLTERDPAPEPASDNCVQCPFCSRWFYSQDLNAHVCEASLL